MIKDSTCDLDELQMVKLARELVINVKEPSQVLRSYGLSNADFAILEQNPFFRRAWLQFIVEWNSVNSTPDRIRLYSAIGIEEGLPVLTDRMKNREEPLTSAVAVGQFLSKMAGIGDPEAQQNSSEKFVITINLGADEKLKFDKQLGKIESPVPKVIDAIVKK